MRAQSVTERRRRLADQVAREAERLERVGENVSSAISELEQATAELADGEGSAPRRNRRRQGLQHEVHALLSDGGPHRLVEIAAALGHASGAVGTALLTLTRDGVVERSGRGEYRLRPRSGGLRDQLVALLGVELEVAEGRRQAAEGALAAAREDVRRLRAALFNLTGSKSRYADVRDATVAAVLAQRRVPA